jgi:HD-GYP domain-containing protein (c-di-GMP phosphodiesterase class II)
LSDNYIMYAASNILSIYKKQIENGWLKAIRTNFKDGDTNFMNFFVIIISKLLDSYAWYLSSDNSEAYTNISSSIAHKIVYKDISYHDFIIAMNLFQESYMDVLSKDISSNDILKYVVPINNLHNMTTTCISDEYFRIKDNTTVVTLVKLAELRDDMTCDHLERTKDYAVLLSKELGLNDAFIKDIERASILHDIGKIGIRDSILLKPGKLTDEEFDEIKKHTVIGAETISEIIKSTSTSKDYLNMARDIALYHHEKYDGSGYPCHLKKDHIPLSARILALVDAYDAITSKRPYKAAATHYEAVQRIISDSGRHFDPIVVNAFKRAQQAFNIINNKFHKDYEFKPSYFSATIIVVFLTFQFIFTVLKPALDNILI